MRRVVAVSAVSALAITGISVVALAGGRGSNSVGPAFSTTTNGRHLTPAGRLTAVGNFPSGASLSPDGRTLWAVDSGHGRDDVQLVDVASGRVRQILPLPGAYGAVTFAGNGRTAYMSGEPLGSSKPLGKTTVDQGDAVHVFHINSRGHAVEAAPIALPPTSGGTAQQEAANPGSVILFTPPGPGPSSGLGWPIGLAATPDGTTLVVALNQADQVDLINLRAHTHRLVKVGRYPYGVVTNNHTAWVTNELDGSVSAVDLTTAKQTATTDVGGQGAHPEGLVLHGTDLYVAVANRDRVVRLSTTTLATTARYDLTRPPGIGTAPVAVTVAGDRLYVADSGEYAIAVVDLRTGRVAGRIPTAAYPTAVAVTAQGTLIWTAAKGLGAGPNPGYGKHFANSEAAPYGTYVPDLLLGRVGMLPVPTSAQLARFTKLAEAQVRPANLTGSPADTVVGSPGGGPSAQIKHVFYVVRENRTYDQIFGREKRGDGAPALELFGDNGTPGPSGGITPNAHALARRFPLLDHFYADSEVSVDGHIITSGAYAIDFVQRALHANYSNRGRIANFGQAPVTLPPNGFLFDQAIRQGVSFKNFGEYSAGNLPAGYDGRPTYAQSAMGIAAGYPLFFGCDGVGTTPDGTNNAMVCDTDSGTLGAGTRPTTSRFDFFQAQFNLAAATGTVPAMTYLTLPNDHTNGVRKNYPTPASMVADNDLGLGQLVDLISHSAVWSSSAIVVVEDDAQDGADHVDAHRMPAFVISPWAKPGAVVHTRYDQLSALRTVEMLVGLKPLALTDGLAEPMFDAFLPGSAKPDLRPYTAIEPAHPIDELSKATASGIEGVLPFGERDLVPQSLFDAALWHSIYGADSTPPAPGPGASKLEQDRARLAVEAWQRGLDPARALRLSRSRDN